ncbi:response regulator [Fibrobacter sp. UWB12]|uniref:hybrid sensor histidine kinase/response regulator n=1 Tax=Fibrobacter sp. UWB12 TaxID=1896203 RepID=UPI0009238ED4|nr:response regulator [Fibrobacter sp. UWB12]SHK36303.1 His Kinase A (phospho-acceptor) domain-containing protein [Fibrobacter sp. UWB12]
MNQNFFKRNLVVSLLLVAFLFIVTNVSFLYINGKAIDDSWDSLDEVAYASEAKLGFLGRSLLSALTNISTVVGMEEDMLSESMVRMIRGSRIGPLVSAARLYLPDGHIIVDQGVVFDSSYIQHYNSIVSSKPYISKVGRDVVHSENIVFEQFVPVRRRGQVVAMLSAVSDIRPLYGFVATSAFKGKTSLVVLDRRDGSFVVEKTGKWNSFNDFIRTITPKSGYSLEEWAANVMKGELAHLAYEEQSSDDEKLLVSLPLFGGCWSLILYVNKNIAFTRVDTIRRFYIAVSAIELLVILLYLLRMVWNARRMAEAESSEYSEIADALSGTYECIFYVNVLDDTFDTFHADTLMNKLHESVNGRDFFFESISSLRNNLYEDDLEIVMHFMEKGAFLKRLEENASASVEYRLVIDGAPQYYRMKVIRSHKDENHVIVAIENIDSEVNKAIAQRQEIDRNNRVIESLASDFDFVNYVTIGDDAASDYVVTYRASSVLLKAIPGWSLEKSFTKRMELLQKYLVCDSDKLQFHEQANRDRLVTVLKDESVVHINFKINLDGKEVFYQMKVIADKDEIGNLKGIVFGLHSVDDEIKKQMQIQSNLKRNLEIIDILSEDYSSLFYFNLVDNTSGVLAVREDIRGALKDLFANCERLEDVFKAFVLDMAHPDDRDKLIGLASREVVAEKLEHQKRLTIVFRHLYGSEYKYTRLVFAKAEPTDVPAKLIAVGFVEVDDQYRAETEHQENIDRIMSLSDQYENVFDVNVDTGLFSTSLNGSKFKDAIDEKTGKALNFFKDKEADLQKTVYKDDLPHVLRSINRDVVLTRLQNENSFVQDYRRVTTNGLKWYRLKVTKMGDWSKSHRVLVGLFNNDIVYRKEIAQQAALEQALEMAKSASRAKTMFLNNMSHDIRTPMNAIIGYTELATMHLDNKDLVKNFLGKIELSSNHLLSLINDVLDMSRIESGKLNLNEKPEHIPEIIHTLKDIVQADINARKLQFFANSIGIRNEDVVCDKLRMNQVLLNVISNAIKYTPIGGSIWFSVEQKACDEPGFGAYEFRIRDSGIGMSEEFLPKIFDAFTRVNSSTVSGIQGTGLGMAITKNIVDMMDGTIDVSSKVDEGTDVVLNFQFKLAPAKQELTKVKELEGKKILVVDDDVDCIRSIPQIFNAMGVEVDCCYSGAEALEKVQKAKASGFAYDAFLVDWRMPDMDGINTTTRLREELGDDILVIVMSAYEWSDIEDKALAVGIRNFVSKPVFPSDARETLLQSFGLLQTDAPVTDKKVCFSGKKVLLVDDNELNREIAEEILEDCGIVVTTACDGEKAVEYMRTVTPGACDLILMDVQMPIMDGYEATRQIRKLNKVAAEIPIIAMTANAFADDQQAALDAGMNEHVAKPVNVNKLKEVLSRFL